MRLPVKGAVLITVAEPDKPAVLETAQMLSTLGFRILATQGTADFLKKNNIACEAVLKMHEGRPHLVDIIKNGDIHLIINTPSGKRSQNDDSYIRKSAIKYKIPYITTTAAAIAAARGIADKINGASDVKSLQAYHADIK